MSDVRYTEYLPIRLTAAQREAIERLAAHDRRSVSEYVRLLIDDHIRKEALDIVLQRDTIRVSEVA